MCFLPLALCSSYEQMFLCVLGAGGGGGVGGDQWLCVSDMLKKCHSFQLSSVLIFGFVHMHITRVILKSPQLVDQ